MPNHHTSLGMAGATKVPWF